MHKIEAPSARFSRVSYCVVSWEVWFYGAKAIRNRILRVLLSSGATNLLPECSTPQTHHCLWSATQVAFTSRTKYTSALR